MKTIKCKRAFIKLLIGSTVFSIYGISMAVEVPIFAQSGLPAIVSGDTGSTISTSVKYSLVTPGKYIIYTDRDPLDVIFTAASPFVTFPDQKSIVLTGINNARTSCKVLGNHNELHCKILPRVASQNITVSGDIIFKPIVDISDLARSESIFTGGSVFYYRTLKSEKAPVYTGSVNFQIKIN